MKSKMIKPKTWPLTDPKLIKEYLDQNHITNYIIHENGVVDVILIKSL